MKSERTQRYRECVVCEREHVPAEYIPLGDLHETEQTLHRYLVKQCEAGKVRRFRLGRLLFVHKDDIDSARRRYEQKRPEAASGCEDTVGIDKSHAESVCLSLASIGGTMDEIYLVLERLTAAVESIATQPKTAQPDGLATMSSNGFHN